MPSESVGFRLGINYWPAHTAMSMWKDLDTTETGEDFARIAEAGFDCVRVFLLWEDFQPEPDEVSTGRLDDLVTVADAAREAGLALMPTLFTGHMSPEQPQRVPQHRRLPERQPGPGHLRAARVRDLRGMGRQPPPREAHAMIEAWLAAWEVTGEERCYHEARLCFDWFLGRNDLQVPLFDSATGGCSDALTSVGRNQNEGAESTVAWLLSVIAMQEARVRHTMHTPPADLPAVSVNAEAQSDIVP